MKKLIVGLFALVMCLSSFKGMGQSVENQKKYLIVCATTSCCSIGPLSFEIWSQRTCYYVSIQKTKTGRDYNCSIKLNTEENLNELEITENVLLAGFTNEEGEELMLEKGTYEVIDKEIFFIAKPVMARSICITKEVIGTFLGHSYSDTWTICFKVPRIDLHIFFLRSASMNTNIDKELLLTLTDSERVITFSEDIELKQDDFVYSIKAGKYFVNEDGFIYLQGI